MRCLPGNNLNGIVVSLCNHKKHLQSDIELNLPWHVTHSGPIQETAFIPSATSSDCFDSTGFSDGFPQPMVSSCDCIDGAAALTANKGDGDAHPSL
jgi:hypothetical protein